MTVENSANDNENQAARLKKIRFRALHRGTREMDMLLGRFIDARLDGLTGGDLDRFEEILEIPDQELYKMLVKGAPPPAHVVGPLMDDLIALSQHL